MKTKISLLAAMVGLAFLARAATDAAKPACCADEKPAVVAAPAACCVEIKPAAPVAKLSERSLYQLDAKWTTDAGATLHLASLHGRPVVLAMFFASCRYACPMLVDDMKRLRESLPADVRAKTQFVLVSFDTARDTPAALSAFREQMALGESWTLLRGSETAVQEFAMLLGVKFKQDASGQFAHSNIITVLNIAGEIAHQRAGLMGDVSEAAKAVVIRNAQTMKTPAPRRLRTLDVRPLVARGEQPFAKIAETVSELDPAEDLVLLTPFLPSPLIEKLQSEGFRARPERRADGAWQTHFTRAK